MRVLRDYNEEETEMKKLVLAIAVMSFGFVAPAFAAPGDDKPQPRPLIMCEGDPDHPIPGCCSNQDTPPYCDL